MKNQDFNSKVEIIHKTFNDTRKIRCLAPEHEVRLDEDVYPGGVIFKTEDGEYIDLEFQLEDFDEAELVKYVDFAENLYEKHGKGVSVYLLCPDNINVLVREFEIKSDADFTIRLARIGSDPYQVALDAIKMKAQQGEVLDCDDRKMLDNIPLMCDRKDRNYFRLECFKIKNRYLN